jgi:hypothetical protein
MEMEQMMACLLAEIKAEIRTNQAKTRHHSKGIKSRPRTPNRRNAGQDRSQDRCQSREDGCLGSRTEGMAKRDDGLPRSDRHLSGGYGANLIGDKSPTWSIRKSLKKRPQ